LEKMRRMREAASSGLRVLKTVGATMKLKKMMLPIQAASVRR